MWNSISNYWLVKQKSIIFKCTVRAFQIFKEVPSTITKWPTSISINPNTIYLEGNVWWYVLSFLGCLHVKEKVENSFSNVFYDIDTKLKLQLQLNIV